MPKPPTESDNSSAGEPARVRALGEGRAHIAFEDISEFATEVLQHRVLLNYDGQAENVDVAALIADCIASLDTTD